MSFPAPQPHPSFLDKKTTVTVAATCNSTIFERHTNQRNQTCCVAGDLLCGAGSFASASSTYFGNEDRGINFLTDPMSFYGTDPQLDSGQGYWHSEEVGEVLFAKIPIRPILDSSVLADRKICVILTSRCDCCAERLQGAGVFINTQYENRHPCVDSDNSVYVNLSDVSQSTCHVVKRECTVLPGDSLKAVVIRRKCITTKVSLNIGNVRAFSGTC